MKDGPHDLRPQTEPPPNQMKQCDMYEYRGYPHIWLPCLPQFPCKGCELESSVSLKTRLTGINLYDW